GELEIGLRHCESPSRGGRLLLMRGPRRSNRAVAKSESERDGRASLVLLPHKIYIGVHAPLSRWRSSASSCSKNCSATQGGPGDAEPYASYVRSGPVVTGAKAQRRRPRPPKFRRPPSAKVPTASDFCTGPKMSKATMALSVRATACAAR